MNKFTWEEGDVIVSEKEKIRLSHDEINRLAIDLVAELLDNPMCEDEECDDDEEE